MGPRTEWCSAAKHPGRDLGVEGKKGVDEAPGASGKSGESVRSGQHFLEATDMRCSRSNFGRVSRVSIVEEELSEELSKRFLELKESAHPGFVRACRVMGLKSPELDVTWSQI